MRGVLELPLFIEGYRLHGLRRPVSSAFVRHTTVVTLRGEGAEGLGEDVTYDAGEQLAFQRNDTALPLAGRFTLGSFSAHLGGLDLFGRPPHAASSRHYRRWAFESAALDLALRQAHRSLAGHLGIAPAPVRFVVSTRVGDPPTLAPLRSWLDLYPGLRFKLDATSGWDDAFVAQVAATGAVDAVDFKGAYRGTIVDQPADPDLYARVARALPEAWLEDPALSPETEAALAGHMQRVTWDAVLHSLADVTALRPEPSAINVKPSRFGSLETLFEVYEYCSDNEIDMYGGGQFELGPGRGQIQYLASLFHPDAPNDVAPIGFNEPVAAAGLPVSPLAPRISPVGFRWHDVSGGSAC